MFSVLSEVFEGDFVASIIPLPRLIPTQRRRTHREEFAQIVVGTDLAVFLAVFNEIIYIFHQLFSGFYLSCLCHLAYLPS